MLYPLIKIWVRLALQIFLREVRITNPRALATAGPLLITANHPDSFLDAIIIGAASRHPIHFLARGDAFNKPWHAAVLRVLQMIPVYRLSEGKENLVLNEESFKKGGQVLANSGILLIFIEGICVNKHSLQPFKKGAARLAIDNKEVPGMRVLPLAIAYDSFSRFGKTITLNCANAIPVKELLPFNEEARDMRNMNEIIFKEINNRLRIPQRTPPKNKNVFTTIGSFMGRMLHWPLYAILSRGVCRKTRGTVFYDSVLFGVLLLVYPVYLLLLTFVLLLSNVPVWLSVLIVFLHPITARHAVQQAT